MKSLRFPSTPGFRKLWPQVDELIERCKEMMEDPTELKHISIDVSDNSVIIFYEEARPVLQGVTIISSEGSTTGTLMSDDTLVPDAPIDKLD